MPSIVWDLVRRAAPLVVAMLAGGFAGCGESSPARPGIPSAPADVPSSGGFDYNYDWDLGGNDTSAPTDAPDNGPSGVDDTATQPPDAAQSDTYTTVSCLTDQHCVEALGAQGLCQDRVCDGGQCKMRDISGPQCCRAGKDCDDGNPGTIGLCPVPGGSCQQQSNPAGCSHDEVLLWSEFDDSTLQGWQVSGGSGPAGSPVNWQITSQVAASGGFALHASYAQVFAENPAPSLLTSPAIDIPSKASVHAFFRVRLHLNPGLAPGLPDCAFGAPPSRECWSDALADEVGDQLWLRLLDLSAVSGELAPLLWSASSLRKTTHGAFVDVALDLTPWAGHRVRLQWVAQHGHVDGAPTHEGAFIDSIVVRTSCGMPLCQGSSDCTSPVGCPAPRCVASPVAGQTGLCWVDPDEGLCAQCNGASACNDNDPCTADACVGGACQWTPSCCTEGVAFGPVGFEAPALPAGWKQNTNSDLVAWRVVSFLPAAGQRHLYFGRIDSTSLGNANYDTGERVLGVLESPPIALPTTSGKVLSTFRLFLDTEWFEGGQPTALAGTVDRFVLRVVPEGGEQAATTVLDSHAFGGYTGADAAGLPAYWSVAADLTPWQGKVVHLRFEFDSGDGLANKYLGVLIDDFAIRQTCSWPADPCWVDGHCAKSACGQNMCWLGECHSPDSACCQVQTDCETANLQPCLQWDCALGRCQAVGLTPEMCCDPSEQNGGDFETSPDDWITESNSAVVGWHWESGLNLAWQGQGALRFGLPGANSYADPVVGAVVARAYSPSLWVLAEGASRLELALSLSTEHDLSTEGGANFAADTLSIWAQPQGQPRFKLWESSAIGGTTQGEWVKLAVPLPALNGKFVSFILEFDTGDALKNQFGGVRIDSLRLVAECAP